MAEAPTKQSRSDLDIKHDLEHLEANYPPLVNDRHQVMVTVNDGQVTVSGYVKSYPTYEFIENHFAAVAGVKSVNIDELYVDETIRRDAGKVIPPGLSINVEYGAVIISGYASEDANAEKLVKLVSPVKGVRRIVTSFI